MGLEVQAEHRRRGLSMFYWPPSTGRLVAPRLRKMSLPSQIFLGVVTWCSTANTLLVPYSFNSARSGTTYRYKNETIKVFSIPFLSKPMSQPSEVGYLIVSGVPGEHELIPFVDNAIVVDKSVKLPLCIGSVFHTLNPMETATALSSPSSS